MNNRLDKICHSFFLIITNSSSVLPLIPLWSHLFKWIDQRSNSNYTTLSTGGLITSCEVSHGYCFPNVLQMATIKTCKVDCRPYIESFLNASTNDLQLLFQCTELELDARGPTCECRALSCFKDDCCMMWCLQLRGWRRLLQQLAYSTGQFMEERWWGWSDPKWLHWHLHAFKNLGEEAAPYLLIYWLWRDCDLQVSIDKV